MISYEFLKKQKLLGALDTPFDLLYLIWIVGINFCNKDETLEKQKTLEVIRYFLESGLFQISDYDGTKEWILTTEEAIKKIQSLWESASQNYEDIMDDPNMWIYFKLTAAGRIAAKEYASQQIYAGENILLLASEKPYINFYDIIKITKEMFTIANAEELYVKILDIASGLWEGEKKFLEIGDLNQAGQFIPWSGGYIREKIEKRWNPIEGEPKNEIAWLRITPEAKKLVEEGKTKGGRLIPEWYTYIDKK